MILFLAFSPDVNFDELSRCTDDYNGAMLKAVCVEAVSLQQRTCVKCLFKCLSVQYR